MEITIILACGGVQKVDKTSDKKRERVCIIKRKFSVPMERSNVFFTTSLYFCRLVSI